MLLFFTNRQNATVAKIQKTAAIHLPPSPAKSSMQRRAAARSAELVYNMDLSLVTAAPPFRYGIVNKDRNQTVGADAVAAMLMVNVAWSILSCTSGFTRVNVITMVIWSLSSLAL